MNYLVATWCPETWTREFKKQFECFAFFSIGTLEEVTAVGSLLNLQPMPWLQNGRFCVAFDHVAGQGLDDEREVKQWLAEFEHHGITWTWSTDLIPGSPPESMPEGQAAQNTFASYEEFLLALKGPIDMKAGWQPDTLHAPAA